MMKRVAIPHRVAPADVPRFGSEVDKVHHHLIIVTELNAGDEARHHTVFTMPMDAGGTAMVINGHLPLHPHRLYWGCFASLSRGGCGCSDGVVVPATARGIWPTAADCATAMPS